MRKALYALACSMVIGCGGKVINVCTVDQQVTNATAASINCGNFVRGSANYTDEAMLAAQRCVLNALTSKQAFFLVYDAESTTGKAEPTVRAAWIGTAGGVDGKLGLQAYAGRGGGDMASADDLVSAQVCDTIDAQQSCKPTVGLPCLTCTSTQIATIVCRGN